MLATNGANINIGDTKGETALHIAAFFGNIWSSVCLFKSVKNQFDCLDEKEVAKVLIENGANVNVANIKGETPLHYTATEGRVNNEDNEENTGKYFRCKFLFLFR